MTTLIESEKELPQFEAVALIEEERRPEPDPVRDEPENREADKSLPLEEARRLARAILRLDGLTGAEIEAAEHVLSVDRTDIRRLREIAGNHCLLTRDFFNLDACPPRAPENRTNGIHR
ncbi:MAG: hypothetical protein JO025_22055 [Verrucomicrobia bacterium]|nr:hypothetical protein [Verrucomicrobiota bacterium]